MALRVGILGTFALIVFAALFLRLWGLEVLSGARYLQTAEDNQLRTVRVQAPRGQILDRNGNVLVTNVPGTAVLVWPADLPKRGAKRRAELEQLAQVVNVPLSQIVAQVVLRAGDPLTPVTVKESVHEDQVAYLYEHQEEFPGVDIAQTYLRSYPHQALAAQLLGHVGEVTPAQVKHGAKLDYRPGDKIGQAGVEASFDSFLRGVPGIAQLRVDSLGRPRSDLQLTRPPKGGETVRLTLDAGLQRAAQQALDYGISIAHADHQWYADGGAIVALDPNDGSVLALASAPTFKPSVYVGRVDPQKLAPLVNAAVAQKDNYPGLDRALEGQYPAGSVFKPVTALAALQEHVVAPYQTLPCTGSYTAPEDRSHQVFNNWDPYANQAMTLPTAIAASCDTYFYQLGNDFYLLPPDRGHPLQAWAARFGFGSPTGIDVGPEADGLLPTPEWRQQTFTKKTDRCCWQIDRLWKPGDSIQLSIGQKDLLVTPIQMARFYALIANGGKLVTPHLLLDVEQAGSAGQPGKVVCCSPPPPPQTVGVDPSALAVLREGLYEGTHLPFGTSSGVFGAFPVPVAGKTGTAEEVVSLLGFHGILNQSWWCGYGPVDSPKLVVCALIENGGHGGTAAAPAALKVFEHYFHISNTQQGTVRSD
jgi:penicillin-binding protein 2